MAIRYSGDCEIRMLHKGGRLFHVVVRMPRDRWSEIIDCGKRPHAGVVLPEEYDRIALVILHALETKAPGKHPFERDKSSGSVTFRRVFQAPCPVR